MGASAVAWALHLKTEFGWLIDVLELGELGILREVCMKKGDDDAKREKRVELAAIWVSGGDAMKL